MTQQIIDLCNKATQLNYDAKYRKGNIVCLPDSGRLVITGDLHGHRRNFEKTVSFADLENNPQTHVVFQEILHGGPEDELGGCLSFNLLFDILGYQLRFPNRVHLLLGNHDTAIISDKEVLKNSKEMNQAMKKAMKRCFADSYDAVNSAIKEYLISQPLAIRCANRIWSSHSLPADRFIEQFDTGIFDKKLEPTDLTRPKSTYLLTWGRRHSDKTLSELARLLDVDTFILGHQTQEKGWAHTGKNLILLASDHNHGCFIAFDLARSYSVEELVDCIIPLASIA